MKYIQSGVHLNTQFKKLNHVFMKFIISLIYQTRSAENNVKYDIFLKTKKDNFRALQKLKKRKVVDYFLF